jgi:hypothetical protein
LRFFIHLLSLIILHFLLLKKTEAVAHEAAPLSGIGD